MRTPDGVERGVAAAVDDHAAVVGPGGEVAVGPHAGEALEVGGPVAAAVVVAPEAERHRREGLGADQLALAPRRAGAPSSSHTSTAMASDRPLDLARATRGGSGRRRRSSRTDRSRRRSRPGARRASPRRTPSRSPRRPAASRWSRSSAATSRRWVSTGRRPALAQRVDELGRDAEQRHLVALDQVEQRRGAGVERAAVVQHDRGLRGQRRHQPVPHHPAAGREEEDPVTRSHVAVEPVLA